MDCVFVIVDVAAELDAQPHQALVQFAHCAALFGGQVETVAAVVAQGEFEQARRVVGQRLGLGAGRVGLQRAVQLFAEAQPGGEDIEPLLLLVRDFAQLRVVGDLREEAEAPAGLADDVADFVQRQHRVFKCARAIGHGGDGVDAPLSLSDRVGDSAADCFRVGCRPVGRLKLSHGALLIARVKPEAARR